MDYAGVLMSLHGNEVESCRQLLVEYKQREVSLRRSGRKRAVVQRAHVKVDLACNNLLAAAKMPP